MKKNIHKILITGANGFIGSHLVDFLLEQKIPANKLRLLVPVGESLENLPKNKFDFIRGDIRDKKIVKKALKDVDTIYHLAAMTVKPGTSYKDYKTTNVEGTQNLLNECKDKKINKFIYFSSIAVYGLPAYVGDIENWDESTPKKYSENYGRSKLEAEKRIVDAHKKYGLPYVIIRPTTVYGPRDHQNITELYKAIKNGYFFRIGNGKNKMDYVFVKDLVKGVYKASESKGKSNDYILGGGRAITFNEVVDIVAGCLNKKILKLGLPTNFGLILSHVTKFCWGIFGLKSPLFPDRVKVMTRNCYFNINKAKREIGYNPNTPFKEGIKQTCDWLKNKKNL